MTTIIGGQLEVAAKELKMETAVRFKIYIPTSALSEKEWDQVMADLAATYTGFTKQTSWGAYQPEGRQKAEYEFVEVISVIDIKNVGAEPLVKLAAYLKETSGQEAVLVEKETTTYAFL